MLSRVRESVRIDGNCDCYIPPRRNAMDLTGAVDEDEGGGGRTAPRARPARCGSRVRHGRIPSTASIASSSASGRGPFIAMMRPGASRRGSAPATRSATGQGGTADHRGVAVPRPVRGEPLRSDIDVVEAEGHRGVGAEPGLLSHRVEQRAPHVRGARWRARDRAVPPRCRHRAVARTGEEVEGGEGVEHVPVDHRERVA